MHAITKHGSQYAALLTAYVTGPQSVRSAALASAVSVCGGGTAIECRGGWQSPDGPVIEPCVRLEVACPSLARGLQLLTVLKDNAKAGRQTHFMYSLQLTGPYYDVVCEELT